MPTENPKQGYRACGGAESALLDELVDDLGDADIVLPTYLAQKPHTVSGIGKQRNQLADYRAVFAVEHGLVRVGYDFVPYKLLVEAARMLYHRPCDTVDIATQGCEVVHSDCNLVARDYPCEKITWNLNADPRC